MLYTNKAIALAFFLYQSANNLANIRLFFFFLSEVRFVFFEKEAKILKFELFVIGSI